MGAMSSVPRLFIDADLAAGAATPVSDNQANYLLRVMRLSEGDEVRVFNGRDGEWLSRLRPESGKRASIVPERQTRPQVETPDLTLFFAPLKKARTDFVVEKACELGVRRIQPVMTERTQSSRVRRDRLQSVVIEAAEQTERMDVPEVFDDITLQAALEAWPDGQPLYYCDEAGDARPMRNVLEEARGGAAGLLIGPEGGFSPKERDWIRKHPNIQPVTLGPRILRAETAVVAALTLWQSGVGDWQEHPYLPETGNG
ncbi:MAG: 16S rRNA (uracil(1498)-N(3))-methyltransferase [Henriciella sp.]|jgi:16S rRNA (uracil1498-N3)-methyltransferase|nr:16S rRNA (uracil(1498)-N(3))-methyltransferase [Henriciella sp.]MAN73212.1 16S rRNA (uracil(1498)-N(3))-methyltransferase [Henriciella sp.]MBF35485.1 16S rRNA (uracil(1498)-N(3))-methyltransferase [Hyphomonadaceae bacterium]MBK75412.1 16S rRNA (uracil(1498)-N(3))-methyltransferase [Henriciella sp.]PHR75686.1 MAG: 16S rRNA (uracil(1498)-N(3))-methyltransferase [Henriciella sp.]|tara:strand:+ start:1570 stop:2340 length:771 start_codon:yes stop_codon:yes gene_type:complete